MGGTNEGIGWEGSRILQSNVIVRLSPRSSSHSLGVGVTKADTVSPCLEGQREGMTGTVNRRFRREKKKT